MQSRRDAGLDHIALRTTPFEGGYRLSGTRRYVLGAAGADGYVFAARADDGLVLGYVESGAAGVRPSSSARGRTAFRHRELRRLDSAPRARIARGAAARAALSRAYSITPRRSEAPSSTDHERPGDARRLHEDARSGRQTDRHFQALQHRAVDLYIQQQLASAVPRGSLRELDGSPSRHDAPRS